jgi:peptidyl-prolyl cis-trans isomerase B (cyclophilin B)
VLNVEKTFLVTFRTSCGDFTVQLDLKAAPKTTASFVALARADFFDGTYFHRIVPNFVIQGGDPTGTGAGGPGYSTVDTPAAGTTYTKGVVAMAKTQAEAPGTAGSQFFVVTAEDAGLPPDYAVIGKVVEGMDVVDLIGTLGDPNTEVPTQAVVIEDARVTVR